MTDPSSNIVSEPVSTYGSNSYMDVMSILHSMPMAPQVKEQVGRRLVLEVTGENLSKAFARVDHLSSLPDGWAGDGSFAISRKVLDNLKKILLLSDDADWKEWMIAPDLNATVGLQSKQSGGCISIGEKEFSYYAEKAGKEYHASHEPITPNRVLDVMRLIL